MTWKRFLLSSKDKQVDSFFYFSRKNRHGSFTTGTSRILCFYFVLASRSGHFVSLVFFLRNDSTAKFQIISFTKSLFISSLHSSFNVLNKPNLNSSLKADSTGRIPTQMLRYVIIKLFQEAR